MIRTPALALVCLMVVAACGPRRAAVPSPTNPDLVVLLPDPDGGAMGGATVSNQLGTVELDAEGAATRIMAGQPPSAAAVLDPAEVSAIFSEALSSIPMPPQSFVLYFNFESNELTDESRSLLPEVLRAVAAHTAPEVVIVGHTDTTGDAISNIALGLTRANTARALLIGVGLETALIEVTSYGEAVPLIGTPDETLEPRNRRVEIAVR